MAAETCTQPAKMQRPQHTQIEEDEVSELIKRQQPPSVYDKVHELAERFASTRLGQFIIERGDRALKMIEDTAKWSLPPEKNEIELERPLSWGPFLVMIVMLRLSRVWLSVGSLLIGNSPVTPADIVYFIQTRRRKLRAIRVHGLKMQRLQQEASSGSLAGTSYKNLTQWLSRAMCWPGVQRANSGRLFTVCNQSEMAVSQGLQMMLKRPRDEECTVDKDLTIEEMLAKYANENSEDDSDFVPNAEDESSSSNTSDSSVSEEDNTSSTEQENSEEHREKLPTIMENGSRIHKPNHTEAKTEPETKPESTSIEMTRNGNGNGSNDKKQTQAQSTEVAQLTSPASAKPKEEESQPQASPTRMAANPYPRFYNNTAAAATTDTDNDTDSSASTSKSSSTVYSTSNSTQSIYALAEVNQETPRTAARNNETAADNLNTTTTMTPLASNPSSYPSVETLTPATSSEDIFYSPIGSPNAINNPPGPRSILKNSNIQSALALSNSEQEKTSNAEAINRNQNSFIPQPKQSQPQPQTETQTQTQSHQQHQQQQQRQHHQQQQRYRGRNRR